MVMAKSPGTRRQKDISRLLREKRQIQKGKIRALKFKLK